MVSGLVSIIMPTYNRARIISDAIKSVLSQEYGDFELIIVDDGSKDNTELVVRQFKDERIIYHAYHPNQGGNHARNVGLRLSKGEYIAFLDTDNKWESSFLTKQIETLNRLKADFCFCRLAIHEEHKTQIVPSEANELFHSERLLDNAKLVRAMLGGNQIDTNIACMRRRCIDENQGFNEKLRRLQDWEFFCRVILPQKYKVAFIPEVMVHSFIQKDSIRYKYDFIAGFLYVFELWMDLYKAHDMVDAQCERIIRLSMDSKRKIARQDALVGLLRLVSEDTIKRAIKKLKLKSYNLEKAKKIVCNSVCIGQYQSILSIIEGKNLIIYTDDDSLQSKLPAVDKMFLNHVNFIACDDIENVKGVENGIPVIHSSYLEEGISKMFIMILGNSNFAQEKQASTYVRCRAMTPRKSASCTAFQTLVP
ncbi:glycosyltransferase family A protein [Selenomonas sp. AB3002]|uniref:glycosyltransferase family 2 protein n=1 Tax=Selenomonas sp. AB3002 TaxID=1392502 RepID=UPI000495E99A